MIKSMRNIASILMAVGVFSFAVHTGYVAGQFCGLGGENCLGTTFVGLSYVSEYQVASFDTAITTPSDTISAPVAPGTFTTLVSVIGAMGDQLILLGALILLILEFFDPHYIRAALKGGKKQIV